MMRGVVIDETGRPLGIQRMWPMLVVRGGLMAALGLATLVWPAVTAVALITLFGLFLLIDGISAIGYGLARRRQGRGGGGWLFQGVVALGSGLVAVLWPTGVAFLALLLMGLFALFVGMILVSVGLALKRARARVWGWPLGVGIVSVVLGVLFVANPAATLVGISALLGVLLLIIGLGLIAGGLKLRKHQLT